MTIGTLFIINSCYWAVGKTGNVRSVSSIMNMISNYYNICSHNDYRLIWLHSLIIATNYNFNIRRKTSYSNAVIQKNPHQMLDQRSTFQCYSLPGGMARMHGVSVGKGRQ